MTGACLLACDTEGHAAAGAAEVEAEHQARTLRRSAMDVGANAERPAEPEGPRPAGLEVVEARPPHQRPVSEDPEIVHIRHDGPTLSLAGAQLEIEMTTSTGGGQ